MSQLIGSTPQVDVLCKALFLEGGEKTTVAFNAIFTRLTRKANKALKQKIQDAMDKLRALSKELLILDQDIACLSADGKIILADARYLKTLQDEEMPNYLTSTEKENHRTEINNQLDGIGESICAEIRGGLHDIKNLKGLDKKVIDFCPELIEDMLDNEGYFNALREGLYKSTGAFEEKRIKN
ncbi:MAG: hypothetical protein ACI88H_000137 [Cocleimonas sp.]|jgi:hypothetical protein